MCGLAGFSGLNIDDGQKLLLTYALGIGADSRGGHSSGFISINGDDIYTAKTVGPWQKAPNEFLIEASESQACVMHSRWATCGRKEAISQAHPFTIKRKGKTVLWGSHNGIIWDAWDSAKANKRKIAVDSQEIFELLADNELEQMQSLGGYGVIFFVEPHKPFIQMARLSEDAEIKVVELENNGGYVFASTWPLLRHALQTVGLKAKWDLNVEEVGRVFEIHSNKMLASTRDGVRVSDPWAEQVGSKSWGRSWDQVLMDQYSWDDEEIESTRKSKKSKR